MAPEAPQVNESESVPESEEAAAPEMGTNAETAQQIAEAQPATALAPETQEQEQPSALSRIPIDEKGEPAYEQADAETAWDAIMEQTEGDENDAREVINSMIADKENELKKLEKSKPKAGTTISQKIAAQKEHKAVVQQARDALKKWQDIAAIPDHRASMAREEAQKAAKAEAEAIRIAAEAEKAKQEEEARQQREALNGVPDYVQDTPTDARARGYRRVNGEKIDRQEPISAPMGKEIEVKFSDNEKPKGLVAVIDAAQLQPSHLNGNRNPLHFIDEAQPKERNDEASRLAAQKIASDIRPEEITSSTTAYTGAPTVNTRGEVIQGNNRSIALRDMWAEYPEQAAKYKQYLMDHAQDYGLNADDIANMDSPVLVNMIDAPDDQAIQLGQYVAQDTESGGVERIKPQNAVRKIGKDMNIFAGLLLNSTNEESSFSELLDANGLEALKWLNKKGIITDTQYKSAFDSKGNINAEAKNDLKGIMYQGIFQNGNTHLEEMFGTLPAKAQRAILATAYRDYDSPQNERLVPEIQQSIMAYYALQQYESFAQAKNYKEAMMAAQDWSRQAAFDDVTGESYLPSERYSNFALLLATMYKGQTQTFIQNTLKKIFDLVQGTQETTLFDEPDNTPRSLVEAINETLSSLSDELLLNENFIYNGQLRNHVLAGSGATGQPRGQGSAGSTTSGGRTESGTGTNDGDRRTKTDSRQSETAENGGDRLRDNGRRGRKTEEHSLSQKNTQPGQKERVTKSTIDPRTMTDTEKKRRGDMLRNAPSIEVREGQITSTPELSARKSAEKWWDENVPEPAFYDTDIGEVEINKNSVESSLAHRYSQAKLDAITSLVDGFENAVYLGTLPDSRERGIVDHYFAYPIKYKGKRNYVFCRVMQDANKNRLYVHEVFVAENIKKGDTLQTAASKPHGGIALYKDILGNILEETPEQTNSSTDVDSNLDGKSDNIATRQNSDVSVRKDTDKSSVTQESGGKSDGNLAENSEGVSTQERIESAEAQTDTNPTEAQKEAGNYKKGHVRIDGYDVTIEQPKGSIRRGKDKNGKAWESKMHYTYGYIRGTEGVDGDHIDVFLSDDPSTGNVFVVDQVDPETGAFDEHKVMYGFNNEEEAKEAYLSNYERGWKGLGNITEVSKDEFKKWIQSSKRKTKPFSEYKIAKKQSDSTTNKTSEYNAPDEKDAIKDLEQEKKTTAEKIGDVGEKIGGAKKDRIKEYAQKIKNIDSDKSSFLKEIVQLPISKIFNFPYDKLRSEGLSNELISMLQTIRKIIPSKPRTKYKLERWASNVFYLYRFSLEVVSSGKDFQQKFLDGANNINGISALYRAYIELGGYDSHLDTGMAGLEELGESAGRYDKEGNWVSLKGQWWLKNAGKHSGIYKTLDEARTNLRKFASENSRTNDKSQTEFSVYSRIKEGDFFITVKGKPNVVVESGFKTSKEAFNYIKEHYDELVSKYTSIKNDTSVNFRENRKRTGKDWRDGKDITAEEFKDTFGFRGVEFGNWTSQKERQDMINNAYDAFMDLSESIGKSPRSLSLNGELAMAFGSRGGGKALAHYESDKIVINLTKTNGAGSLAHEWWHAIDNYFSRHRGDQRGFNSNREGYKFDASTKKMRNPDERGEVTDAFADLMRAIENSGYGKRSRNYASLKSSYWNKPTELGARAFAVWIERKLAGNGISNDFLVNNPIIWDSSNIADRYYPYPMESDFESLDTAFDNLFNAIQEKTDKQTGKTILFNISDIDNVHMTENLQAVYDTVIGMLDDAGIEVEILSNDEMEKMAGRGNAFLESKKKVLDTRLLEDDASFKGTVVSSTHGTKILNNLDSLAKEQEKSIDNRTRSFLGDVAKALGARQYGSKSQYATFETMNGQVVTIRLADHNASTRNFDNAGRENGISIVISRKPNQGITNDGDAHLVEFFYPDKALQKADGKPLAEIVRSIKQTLYSGEYKDTTGLAQRQEVNAPVDEVRGSVVYGATKNGKIYLNGSALNPETPIHEYTHIWDAACQKKNPELWKRGVELMKQTPIWNEVKNDPNYAELQTDNEIASEVHSRLTGADGASRMERMVSEARKNGAVATAESVNLRERLQKWLNDFWYWLKDTMTPWTKEEAKRVNLEDFINMPLKDMAQGTDLNGNEITIEKSRTEENELNTANKRFNDELDAFKAKAHKGLLHLGKPGKKLKACGIDTELTLSPTVLSRKLKQHGFDVDDIKDLAKAIQDPILVYQHGDVRPNIVVVTDLTAKNGKISVAVELNEEGNVVELNNLSSVRNKDAITELERLSKMRNGYLEQALRWVDKNKIEDWITQQRSNSAEVEIQNLDVAVKVVENFKNPNIEDENLREGNGPITDDELSYENDPIAKVLGKSTRSAKQRKSFAERERRNMINTLQEFADKLNLNNVEFVTDASTLSGRKARAKGFYSRDTGKITIVIPNHTSVQDAVQTLLHEAVAHYGLRKLFGENFDNFLDNVFNNAEPDVRERIVNLASKRGWDFRTATEEYLASLAENTNFENIDSSWWMRIKQFFLDMLNKLGLKGFNQVPLSDNELRYILWRSYQNLSHPEYYNTIFGEAEDIAKQNELKVGNYAPTEIQAQTVAEESIVDTNRRFNEELAGLTEENKDKVVLSLGRPSAVLQAAGVEDRPMKLYGNKVVKKMKKHGFSLDELKNLPIAVANPIAVFNNYQKDGNRSVLTELKAKNGNILVTLDLGIDQDVDFNVVTSVFGKRRNNIINWLNNGYATYINKKKALAFLSYQSAPIAATAANAELSSAANIIRSFKNPNIEDENLRTENSKITDNELKVGNHAPSDISVQTVSEESIADTNRRFNEELRQQIDGNLPKGHVYELGRPGRVLRSTGIPDLPIELAASRLGKKASKDYESNHPFELESVMDLPKAIQHPIAVFESKTKAGSKVIMVELKDRNGNNFVVAMNTNVPKNRFSKASIQINDIRSIYPKDNVKDIVNWINRGDLLRYADKKKIEDWITQQRSNSAEVEIQNLDVAAKVVENFKNPNIEEENNNLLFRDGDETSPLSGSTIDAWDKLANSFKFQLRETSVDYLTAVEKFQQLIEKSSGKKIQDYENAYDYMTFLSSKNRQEMDMFDSFIVKPINKAISNLVGKKHTFGKWTWEKGPLRELVMYVEAKHGTDRNRQMAVENSINDFKAPNLEFFENAGIGFDMNVYKQELEEAGKTAYDAAYEKAREKMNEETPEAEENAKKKAELAELRAKEVFADKKMQQLNEQYREKQYNDWMQAKETINSTEGLSWKDKQDMLDEEAHKLNADLLRDYSGLSSVFGDKEKYPSGWLESARNYVTEYESSHPEENIKQLWNTIGNATRYALEKQYETGLVSADYVRRQRQRFDNYIPLRGFEDEIAGDVYKYIGSEFYPGSNPVKTAHGRTSEAGNPFGSILNTAYSSISVGNKNMAKMAFYSLVVNHDTGGLAVANRAWMVKYDALKNDPELEDLLVMPQSDGNEETTEWVEAVPKMADGLTASEMKDVLDRFDKAMKKGQREEITKPIGKKANIAYRTLYKERNEHDIPLFISGDKYVITITGNPRVAQSMNGLLNPDVDENGLAQMAKKIQQFMAGAFTSKNAAFSIANLAKDTIYSNNQTFIRENPLYWLKFTINQKAGFGAYPKMMEMLFKYQRGTLDVSKKIERDFQKYFYSHKAKKVIQSFFDLVEFAGQSAKLVNRFAAYLVAIEE